MATILSVLIVNDARPDLRPVWIDMPFTNSIQRLEDAVERLGISEDKEDLRVLRYRSTVLPEPDADFRWDEVDRVAQVVAKFTPPQFKCLKRLRAAFGLEYEDVSRFVSFLCTAKGLSPDEMAENGVPAAPGKVIRDDKANRENAL